MTKTFTLASIILLFLFTTSLFAQNSSKGITVKGQIVDSLANEPVAYATLQVTPSDDPKKTVKVGTSDENGNFELSMNKKGKYILSAYYIGKKNVSIPFEILSTDKQVNISKIFMEDNQLLDEVVVAAVKPLVAVDLDKIAYSTEDDPDSKTNNVLDMLRKVPMITIDAEDKIELKGSTSFKIHIDGKPSNLVTNNPSDVLKSMPANSVKRIEVITDPGAKYDAEGVTGIINIITNKQPVGGYTVSLNANASTSGSYGGGVYASAKYGKFGFTGNFNYTPHNTRPRAYTSEYRESFTDDKYKYLNQDNSNTWDGTFRYGYGELTYELDTLNLFSVSFNTWGGGNSSQADGLVAMQDINHNDVYNYRQQTDATNGWGSTGVNASYQRSFRKKDEQLTASYRYNISPNTSESETRIDEAVYSPSSWQKMKNDADDKEHTFQIDYTTPIAKIHTIEGGAKYIIRLNESHSGHELYDYSTGAWSKQPSNNDHFKYRYNITAAYLGYNMRFKAVGFKAGLRLEDTKVTAEYPLNSAQDFGAHYATLVPSTTITYKFKQSQTIRIGYSMRVQRPGIWYLNPYTNESDPKNISQGNPDLDVEKAHNISLNYSMFKPKLNINTSLYYNHTGNTIQAITTLLSDTSDVSYTTYQNMGSNNRVGLDLYANWNPSTKFRMYVNASLHYNDIRSGNESGLKNSGFGQRISGNVQYTFPLNFIASVNGGWSSPRINIQGQSSSYYYYNIGLSKSFLDKKLTFSTSMSNIFDKYRRYSSQKTTSDFYSNRNNCEPARFLRFSVSYRFGEMKQQIKKVQRSISNDDAKAGESGSESSGQ